MNTIDKALKELGVSKVSLSKYLGVSRQMLYNYLALDTLEEWPKEKQNKLMSLFNINNLDELKDKEMTTEYINEVKAKMDECIKDKYSDESLANLKNFNKKEQYLFMDIMNLIKTRLENDVNGEQFNTFTYLYNFMKALDSVPELKYILAYFSKTLGDTAPLEFIYDEENQKEFECILFTALPLYGNGAMSQSKINATHKKFVDSIAAKKEEVIARTQELNNATAEALKELGYSTITADNGKEVLEKIAEIQSRKI